MEKTKISKRNTHAPALSIMAQGVLRGDFFLEPTKTISGAQRGVPLGWTVKCLRPCVVLYADGSSMELSYAVRVNKAMNSSLGNSSPGREQRDFNCPSQLILTFNYLKRKKSWVYIVFLIITKWWLYRIAERHRQGKDRGIAESFIFFGSLILSFSVRHEL